MLRISPLKYTTELFAKLAVESRAIIRARIF
jgi:hypothetical protein